jgi:hypothetical protein
MKRNLFVLSIITIFLTIPALAFPVEGLLGRWTAQNLTPGRGVYFQLSFDFQPESTRMTVKCLYERGGELEAQTQAHTGYNENEIYIHETKESVVSDGYRFCRATLQPALWTAYFDGAGKMILFIPAPYQTRFTLVRDEI